MQDHQFIPNPHSELTCNVNGCYEPIEARVHEPKFMTSEIRPKGLNPKDIAGMKKTPLRFVPPSLMIAASGPLALGATKYGNYNWRGKNITTTLYIEAILRHLFAFLDGEDLDSESGLPHIHHAVATLAVLIDSQENGNAEDDRPPRGPSADMLAKVNKSQSTTPVVTIDYKRVSEIFGVPLDDIRGLLDERRVADRGLFDQNAERTRGPVTPEYVLPLVK